MEDIIIDFLAIPESTAYVTAYVKQHHYAIQNHQALDFRPFPEINNIDVFLETSHWNQPIYLHSGVKHRRMPSISSTIGLASLPRFEGIGSL